MNVHGGSPRGAVSAPRQILNPTGRTPLGATGTRATSPPKLGQSPSPPKLGQSQARVEPVTRMQSHARAEPKKRSTPPVPPPVPYAGGEGFLASMANQNRINLEVHGQSESASIEDRFQRIEFAQDKLVQATVDAIHHHQTILEVAEERWKQQLASLEEEANQQRMKLASLEEEANQQRMVQYATSTDVHALKVVLTAQAESGVGVGRGVGGLDYCPTPNTTDGADSMMNSTSMMNTSQMTDLMQAITSNVTEQNEHHRTQITQYVTRITKEQGNVSEVASDVEGVRNMFFEAVKVSHALAMELKRLKHAANRDYDEITARVEKCEELSGMCSRQQPNSAPEKAERQRESDDAKFIEATIGAIYEMQKRIQQNERAKQAQRDQSPKSPDPLQDSKGSRLSRGSHKSHGSSTTQDRADALSGSHGSHGANKNALADQPRFGVVDQGEVGDAVKLLRDRLNPAPSNQQNPVFGSGTDNLTVEQIAEYRDRLLRQF